MKECKHDLASRPRLGTCMHSQCYDRSVPAVVMLRGSGLRFLLNNHLVAKEPAVVALGQVPFGQRAGILGHHTEMTGSDFGVADGEGAHKAAAVAEIGGKLLGVRQLPLLAVGRGVDFYGLRGEYPVVGIVEEAHSDILHGG